jgi:hypothetical protein
MTGPEHYAEGERLLAYADSLQDAPEVGAVVIAGAHAHFAAAQVAATIEAAAGGRWQSWLAVLGEAEPGAF